MFGLRFQQNINNYLQLQYIVIIMLSLTECACVLYLYVCNNSIVEFKFQLYYILFNADLKVNKVDLKIPNVSSS